METGAVEWHVKRRFIEYETGPHGEIRDDSSLFD